MYVECVFSFPVRKTQIKQIKNCFDILVLADVQHTTTELKLILNAY